MGLACALAADPDILLMDEPFSALDPLIRRQLQQQFAALSAQLHKTMLFITHDLDEAIRIGTRIAIMKDGRIVQLGTPEEIVTQPEAWIEAVPVPSTYHTAAANLLDDWFDRTAEQGAGAFDAIAGATEAVLNAIEAVFVGTPWPVYRAFFLVAAWRLAGVRVAIFTAAALACARCPKT